MVFSQSEDFGVNIVDNDIQEDYYQKYLSELYNMYVDIEKKFLRKENKEVDKAESLVLYTRN